MRRMFLTIVAAVMICGPGVGLIWGQSAQAQEALARMPGIESTIQSQIDAFRADDFSRAFDFASPAIRNIFRTPENFGAMVRNGYPMVWRPGSVRFGDLRQIEGALWQQVIVTDAQGTLHVLDYRMEQGPDGWLISGVQLLPGPDLSA